MKKIRDQKVKITDQTDVPAVSCCAAALNQRRKACAAALPKESEAPFSCAAAEYQRRSFAPGVAKGFRECISLRRSGRNLRRGAGREICYGF